MKLSFLVKSNGEMVPPQWTEIDSENTECPKCHSTMVVVLGKKLVYAYCGRCNKYFVAEG